MGLNIDELDIKISGSSDKAEKSIDKLITRLEALKKSVNRTSGLDKLSEKLNKISASINSVTGLDKLSKLAESITKLSTLKAPNVTKMVNSIKKLSEACNAVGNMSNVDTLRSNITAITEACKPMENMGKNNLSPFLNSLKKIPEITKQLDTSKINEFAAMIRQLTAAIEPLTTQVTKSEKGLVALNSVIKSTVAQNGNLASSNAAAVKSYTSLSSVLRDVRTKILALYVGLNKAADFLSDCLISSSEYVENINLFTVAMGEYADEAYAYAKQVNSLLGIDISEWIRFQGVFKQITTGFGVAADKSNIMSKNLTQIGYDIASFFNISIDESMQKVQSGISGELEPLRRLGYALDAATLQQIAYDNGITQNINTMTQAQKSQLRYIAIMQQSANVMGDMARTIITPANSMRILQQQMEQFKRAIGNIVSIFVVKLIPYVQVLIRLLTDAANAIADWLGFELPTIDYSEVGKGLSSVTEEADDATEAVKETQKQLLALAGFDEINQLNLDKGTNNSGDDNAAGNKYDLGIDLPEYDFLAGLDEQTDKLYRQIKAKLKEIYNWLKKHKKMLETIAGILATVWALGKIKKFIDKVKELSVIQIITTMFRNFLNGFKGSKATTFLGKLKDGFEGVRSELSLIQKIGVGAVFGTIGGIASYDFFNRLADGTLSWQRGLGDAVISLGSIAAAFAIGGPIAGGIAIVGNLVGAFVALKKNAQDVNELWGKGSLFDNGGVKISELTDLFAKQYDKVIETSEKIEEYKKTISENNDKINDAADDIKTLNSAFGDTSRAMSEDDLTKIQNDFETIATAIKDNIGLATQGVLDTFSGKISTVAENIGIDLDGVIGDLRGFESAMSSNADEAQRTVDDYWQMIYKGITPTEEQTKAYEQANGYLRDTMRKQREELTKAKDSMQEAVDFSKIDFGDMDSFKKSMDDLTNSTSDALKAVESTYNSSLENITSLYQEAQLQYKHGLLSDEEFAFAQDTYNKTKSLLKADMEQTKKDIEEDYSTLTGAIQSQFDENVQWYADYFTGIQLNYWKYGESVTDEQMKKAKIKAGKSWDSYKETQEQIVRNNFSDIQQIIQDSADKVEIKPDISKGKNWLTETIGTGSTLALPSVQKTLENNANLLKETAIKQMDSKVEKFGLTASSKMKTTAAKNFNDYNSEFASKIPLISGTLDNVRGLITSELDIDLSGYGKKTMQSYKDGLESIGFNVGISAMTGLLFPSVNVQGYASGGFPQTGQVFVARENGIPEMVGSIGGKNAVANNGQIEQALFKAVYTAMRESSRDTQNSRSSQSDVNLRVTADKQSFVQVAVDGINDITRRTGKSPLKS